MSFRLAANQDIPVFRQHWREVVHSFGGADFVVGIVRRAHEVILDVYGRFHHNEQQKEDGSPVSEADLAAAALIEAELATTRIPVVCEESVTGERPQGPLFWLVDPLDGTKEFLARNGEFTVNVALVAQEGPVLGVIGVPVTGEVYVAVKGGGAFKLEGAVASPLFNRRTGRDLVAAVSRSHGSDLGDAWLESFGVGSKIRCGSAIKFCRVAEGKADLYVRFGRTMEWDTAAGHCILEECGCKLVVADTGEPLTYGKSGFANPGFIAARADLNVPGEHRGSRVGNL